MRFVGFHRIVSRRAFTLLEMLGALMIFAIAVLGFRYGQSGTAKLVIAAEHQGQAIALAQKQMTEIEIQLRNKSFKALPEEEKGEFKDEAFKNYQWSRKFEKVDLGCFMPTSKGEDSSKDGVTSTFEKIFDEAVRKIKVTVEWKEGNKTRSQSLTQLYVRFQDFPTGL